MPQNVNEILDLLQKGEAFTFERTFRVDRAAIDEESRTVNVAFASDKPIDHWFGKLSLSMDKKAMRSERLKSGAPLLMDHRSYSWEAQVGVIERFSIDNDGVARADVRFSRSARGEEVFQDVKDGIRQNISVGFMVHEMHLEKQEKDKKKGDLYRSDDWEPYEISIVSVPADISVGVGRSAGPKAGLHPLDFSQHSPTERAIQTPEDNKMTPEEIAAAAAEAARSVETPQHQASPQLAVIREINAFAEQLGPQALSIAETYRSQDGATVNGFLAAVRAAEKAARAANPNPPPDPMDPHTAAARQNGEFAFQPAGDITIDAKSRRVLESRGYNLEDKQIAACSTRAYKLAFTEYVRKKGLRNMGMDAVRALSEGADTEGGFTVPTEFIAQMIEREPAMTSLQNQVTTLNVGSDRVVMPKNKYSASDLYTTGVRAAWVDEKTGPSSEADASDFGNITIPIHTAMMYHDVTKNLIEDSAFDIVGWLTGKFSETTDVLTESVVVSGTGIGQPAGILMNPNGTDQPAQVVSGDANLLTADGLMDLTYSLLGRYVDNARFVFNRLSTEKAIAKLKDSQNRYLFAYGDLDRSGLVSARPATLLGFPIISSDFMPNVAANAYPIIFGDLRGYYLARRIGFSIQILEEIVATANKVRVLGRVRLGGQVAEDWRLKIQKVSA